MKSQRTLTAAANVVVGLALLTACSSSTSSTSSATSTGGSLDRSNVDAVADAFATAYAGGNTPAACALATGSALTEMNNEGLCQTSMSWKEIPTRVEACPVVNGQARFVYQVGHEIERFLLFGIKLTSTAGQWSVTQLGGHTPGDKDYGCSNSNSTSGG